MGEEITFSGLFSGGGKLEGRERRGKEEMVNKERRTENACFSFIEKKINSALVPFPPDSY